MGVPFCENKIDFIFAEAGEKKKWHLIDMKTAIF